MMVRSRQISLSECEFVCYLPIFFLYYLFCIFHFQIVQHFQIAPFQFSNFLLPQFCFIQSIKLIADIIPDSVKFIYELQYNFLLFLKDLQIPYEVCFLLFPGKPDKLHLHGHKQL